MELRSKQTQSREEKEDLHPNRIPIKTKKY